MKIGKYHFITRAEFLKIIRMNYEYEFSRLLEAVNQFLRNKESKACLTVLENASQFYESQKPTHNSDYAVTPSATPISCRSCINLLTCIQARPAVILKFQLCDEWERQDFT